MTATTKRQERPDGVGTEFLLEEYRGHEAAIYESERAGETRVNFFLTVTGAIVAALMFELRTLVGDTASTGSRLLIVVVLLALLLFGQLTLARVVHRNLTTDREIEAARRIRSYVIALEPWIAPYVSRPTATRKTREKLSVRKLVTRGGLAETVMLWNALLTTTIFATLGFQTASWVASSGGARPAWLGISLPLLFGVLALPVAWWGQQAWVNERYATGERERAAARSAPEVTR